MIDSLTRIQVERQQLFDEVIRPVVRLQMHFPNDEWKSCSGVLIGDRTVLTAGHCIKFLELGGTMTDGWVFPTQDNEYTPYSATHILNAYIGGGWFWNQDPHDDWAIVTLGTRIGNVVGWAGLCTLSDIGWDHRSHAAYGYPGDLSDFGRDMFDAPGTVYQVEDTWLRSTATGRAGQSGSAVRPQYLTEYACAVFRGEFDNGEAEIQRITNVVYNQINSFMSAHENDPVDELTYTHWTPLGGFTDLPPKLVSYPNSQGKYFEAFVRGLDGQVYTKRRVYDTYTPTGSSWKELGYVGWDFPAAAKRGLDLTDVLTLQRSDDAAYNKGWYTNSWQPSDTGWWPLGGTFVGPLTALACGAGGSTPQGLWVFGIDAERRVRYKYWNPTTYQWGDWYSIGYPMTIASGGVAATCHNNSPKVAVCSDDQALYTKYLIGGFDQFTSAGLPHCDDTPTLVDIDSTHFDVLAHGGFYDAANVYHARFTDSVGWGGSANLGGGVYARIAAISRSTSYLDIYVVDFAGGIYTKWYSGGQWGPSLQGWAPLGGFMFDVDAATTASNRVELIARGRDGQLYERWWNGSWSQ